MHQNVVLGLVVAALMGGCGDGDPEGAGGGTTSSSQGGASSTSSGAGATSASSSQSSSASSGGGLPAGCIDYSTFTPTVVSFAADVMPVFAQRCQSCHDDPTASTYYGADSATVYQKLLDGTPKQAPHLRFVVPGDPLTSYMMAKVEYDDPGGTCPLVACSEPGCELSAPPGNPLPQAELDILRSWVLGGALND